MKIFDFHHNNSPSIARFTTVEWLNGEVSDCLLEAIVKAAIARDTRRNVSTINARLAA
jgi:hypothetical protein